MTKNEGEIRVGLFALLLTESSVSVLFCCASWALSKRHWRVMGDWTDAGKWIREHANLG